ncbi:MAG TPA: S41 family peptidase [Anaerolineales bacterium]|nr:S41 family peptidase [Anaerolineales bacterium]
MARRIQIALTVLVLAALSCQAAAKSLQPGKQSDPKILSHAIQRATRTPLPSATATITPQPATATPIPPTATATWTVTPTAAPGDAGLQQRVFEALWAAIQQDYLYPDYNGLNWDEIFDEYSARIEEGLSDQAFYLEMEELVSRLNDEHSVFLGPVEALDEDSEYSGENDYVGIGVLTSLVAERRRLTIIAVFHDSPAEAAGIQVHDSILAVDGTPIVGDEGFRRNLLRGPEGSNIELTIQTPGQQPRQVRVTRSRVTGSVPIDYTQLASLQGKRVGYILLPTFADDTVDDQFRTALENLSADGPLDGLVLDNRQNSGGADSVARNILGYFVRGNMGYFIDRDQQKRAFNILGADIQGSSSLPIVVLVGPNTASFGEIFAGVLRDNGRAVIIGEPTEGNIEVLWRYDFEDGSRAWIARETFRPLQNPDQDWELTGIIPDQVVPANWDEHTLDTDPAVKAALLFIDSLK